MRERLNQLVGMQGDGIKRLRCSERRRRREDALGALRLIDQRLALLMMRHRRLICHHCSTNTRRAFTTRTFTTRTFTRRTFTRRALSPGTDDSFAPYLAAPITLLTLARRLPMGGRRRVDWRR